MRAGDNNSAAQHTAVNILLCQQSGGRESAMFATYRTRARDDIRAVSPAVNPGRGTTACRPRCADHGLSPTSALAAPRAVLKCSSAASRQGGACRFGAEIRREINHGGRTSVPPQTRSLRVIPVVVVFLLETEYRAITSEKPEAEP